MNDATETPRVHPVGNWYRLVEMPQLYGGNPPVMVGHYYQVIRVEGSNFWVRDHGGHETSFGSSRFDLEHPVVLPSPREILASQKEWRKWAESTKPIKEWYVAEGNTQGMGWTCRLMSTTDGWYVVVDLRHANGLSRNASSYWLIRIPILGVDNPDPGGMWKMGEVALRTIFDTSAPHFPRGRGSSLKPAAP